MTVLDRRSIPYSDFRLADLTRMRVATDDEVQSPWLCLQEDSRSVGVYLAQRDGAPIAAWAKIGRRCVRAASTQRN
jgi:hypothetical protein